MFKKLRESIKRCLPDKFILKYLFWRKLGYKLDLKNPKTFNQKLQWLKLYDRNPLYTTLVDKYAVKDYVANIIGNEHIIPVLGVWNHFNEIDFNKLPNQFVLKCTHDSGSVIVCKDKSTFDIEKAKNILEKGLKHNFFYDFREWPYKNVKPRIIAEKFMIDKGYDVLTDYKVFCFNGEPKFIQTHPNSLDVVDRQDFYDTEWNRLSFVQKHYPPLETPTEKPELLTKMLELSSILTKSIPEVRCDWYIINNQLYFGEFTFYDGAGFSDFEPIEWNEKLGDLIDLKLAWKNK